MKISLFAACAFFTAALPAATYRNPVLHFDFSDPDVCIGRDGRAYLTASSFGALPGLPVLVSDDLVNWSYVGHALTRHPFPEGADTPQHGNSVWAPAIRYRADRDEYVIYWGDPDRGAYRVSAKDPAGPWSAPRLVVEAKGLIDTCPLYDDDGRVYLVNGWANSRAGMNSVLTVRELDAGETCAISDPVLVYDGLPRGDSTAEGPKFYKKDGEYWLWFPAGGVGRGWQVAARAKSPYGPYEAKTVLAQGDTPVNGPHQGAAVNLGGKDGEDRWWFLHFSDREAYGRIVYLEPMQWSPGAWPVVGDGGKPVLAAEYAGEPQRKFGGLAVSDEFNEPVLGPQWHFLGKSSDLAGWPTTRGFFRLYTTELRGGTLWTTPNLMVQKFPAERFTVTLKAQVGAKQKDAALGCNWFSSVWSADGSRVVESGLVIAGRSSARLGLRYRNQMKDAAPFFEVVYVECMDADCGGRERPAQVLATIPAQIVPAGLHPALIADIYLRVAVAPGDVPENGLCRAPVCTFSYSTDGRIWTTCPTTFTATTGRWIGATFGLYAIHDPGCDRGWLDADWLRVE
ncbi:MAG: family 43 glycosylhydrolase [Kiritimatiellia bacterium]